MKLGLKSLFPSSVFNKMSLKVAVLVALVIFYLVIMFSSSREGMETEAPKTVTDIKNLLDQVTNTTTEPKKTTPAMSDATPTPDVATSAPAKTSEAPSKTSAAPSKTPYGTY